MSGSNNSTKKTRSGTAIFTGLSKGSEQGAGKVRTLSASRSSSLSSSGETTGATTSITGRTSMMAPPGLATCDLIESKRSQYSSNSKSGCTLMAAEASLLMLSEDPNTHHLPVPKVEIVDAVLDNCSNVQCDHLAIQDVLESMARYSKGFRVFAEGQHQLSDLASSMNAYFNKHQQRVPFSILLTKPPESIALIVQSLTRFFVFDSHKRNNTRGAYFYVTNSMPIALKYIQQLWPLTEGEFGVMAALQFEMMNTFQFCLVERTLVPIADLPGVNLWKIMHDELAEKVTELTQKVAAQAKELESCQAEIREQRNRNANLEGALANFFAKFLQIQASSASQQQAELMKLAQDFKLNDVIQPSSGLPISPQSSVGAEVLIPSVENGQQFKCCQCQEVHPIDFVFNMTTCEHRMCRSCAREIIGDRVRTRKYPIMCPVKTCSKILDPDDVTLVLNENEMNMFAAHTEMQRSTKFY